jgi:hypothetical protein
MTGPTHYLLLPRLERIGEHALAGNALLHGDDGAAACMADAGDRIVDRRRIYALQS